MQLGLPQQCMFPSPPTGVASPQCPQAVDPFLGARSGSHVPPGSGMPGFPSGVQPRGSHVPARTAHRWQEAYLDLEQENRKVQGELREKSEEVDSLGREAQSLREQIRQERERRREKVAELSQQLEALERENSQLQMKLMKVQFQDSAKLTDVTTVKKEVVAKTMELEKMMREFQQAHQERLFARVASVTEAMLSVCQRPEVAASLRSPSLVDTDDVLHQPLQQPSALKAPREDRDVGGTGQFLDLETQQALKRRLQALGDVVVYTNDKAEACCASGRVIPPGTLRVRPRRCDHSFLVECLMPYWAEGLCPVCRCSFAYDRPDA